ncbi:Replication factor-A protein 1-like protein [Arabidopsis thaliana]|nr:Replication factor-A protein 1-like protein [Arabidopsis thaliana]ANM66784.1 Replication factor-A protein 1-like protein [Arabidopsis thaliana]|eukprot:NP_001328660.1 Replication factor-A protein 1-like protein [Arabidopsis thaliana]
MMEVSLTAGAIGKIMNGEVTTEADMIPVLQVTDLKQIMAQQDPTRERFRMVLSDGTYLHQGMLGTDLNNLVKEGTLQPGSIVRLTRFVGDVIKGRRIVIVPQLEVLKQISDIIGHPVPGGKHNDQRGADSGIKFNTTEQQGSGIRQVNNIEPGRSNAAISPQVGGTGSSVPASTTPSTRAYSNPSSGNGVTRQDYARDPPTSYPHQPQPPPPMYANRGPVARNEAPPKIIPVNALSPYSGRWTIKARVTNKAALKQYSNPRGEGKVFNFDLLDADGGEIRVTCFNAVADQFYDQIVVGNLYLISRGSLRPAQKNFNHLRNDYEIMLDNASTIKQCYEEDAAIPRHQFHFRTIGDIESMENNCIVDVIGIVSSISPTVTITRKNGTATPKRSLQLKDMSGRSVEVTMWGDFCNAEGQRLQSLCDSGVFPVLAVKAGRISEFNGKTVSTIGSSQLFIDPDFVEAEKLKNWFEREGKSVPCISLSREFSGSGKVDVRKTISQIKDEKLGTSEKPDWITVSATILYLKFDNFCYTACPIMNGDRPCSKKVTDNGDGTWRCEKCDKSVDECDYRYILQLQIQDHTDLTCVTAFQEAGEEIMGISAKDLYYVKNEHKDEEKFEDIIRKVAFTKYNFKLKVKEETFSDEQRVKATVVKVDKLNYSADTRTMLGAMDKLRTRDANSLPINPEGSDYNADVVNTGIGSSGTRDPSSVQRRDFGLHAHQSGQSGNHYSGGGATTSCNVCGNSGHVSAKCPGATKPQEQGQYMGGSYRGTTGSYGGGLPRQHVGSY